MVSPLGAGRFYGRSLPRPRFYDDVNLNDERVDPPSSVMDPFLSWAREAHWSMGGLNFTRHRLQGRIEGNIKKFRLERERFAKKLQGRKSSDYLSSDLVINGGKRSSSTSPPPAPLVVKKRRFMTLLDEREEVYSVGESDSTGGGIVTRRGLVRNLSDDFDRVSSKKASIRRLSNQENGKNSTYSGRSPMSRASSSPIRTRASGKGIGKVLIAKLIGKKDSINGGNDSQIKLRKSAP